METETEEPTIACMPGGVTALVVLVVLVVALPADVEEEEEEETEADELTIGESPVEETVEELDEESTDTSATSIFFSSVLGDEDEER